MRKQKQLATTDRFAYLPSFAPHEKFLSTSDTKTSVLIACDFLEIASSIRSPTRALKLTPTPLNS